MQMSDVFVAFDTVQYNPRHEENRARVKGANGARWLTVPMRRVSREQRIVDTRIDDEQPWRKSAMGVLQNLYADAPQYEKSIGEIEQVLQGPHETLTELDEASWEPALRRLSPRCDFHRASQLPVSGAGPRLLLDICKHVDCDVYLSGPYGRDYIDVSEFGAEGVEVRFLDYEHPVYPQPHGEFEPYLSYLDMLFHVGLDGDALFAEKTGA
jgi:hypothetical protein